MAHCCPECGMLCYCRGDIDDCELDGGEEEMNCEHCDEEDRVSDDDPQQIEDNHDARRTAKP